jgi:hypothetical protein
MSKEIDAKGLAWCPVTAFSGDEPPVFLTIDKINSVERKVEIRIIYQSSVPGRSV